jgi:hypothetical protein
MESKRKIDIKGRLKNKYEKLHGEDKTKIGKNINGLFTRLLVSKKEEEILKVPKVIDIEWNNGDFTLIVYGLSSKGNDTTRCYSLYDTYDITTISDKYHYYKSIIESETTLNETKKLKNNILDEVENQLLEKLDFFKFKPSFNAKLSKRNLIIMKYDKLLYSRKKSLDFVKDSMMCFKCKKPFTELEDADGFRLYSTKKYCSESCEELSNIVPSFKKYL